jgi:hypothetical protein
VCPRCSKSLLLGGLAASIGAASAIGAATADVLADAPTDLSVTVYRAPDRGSGSIDLDDLAGFALISETRTVHLAAGESRLRFEGVADGIEPASAIVTGLEDGVLEKNRDAALLSPAALMAAALGKPVVLVRTNPKAGSVERLPGTILSDADGGVVFESAQGIEALRCSGSPETVSFEGATALGSHPTLSVRVRTSKPVTTQVTLSYLAHGFDWAADYTATVSPDGTKMDLGAWVTLANGNGVGFPAARTQVVAGRVNRESGELEPIDAGGPILANCWPRGSTSDIPPLLLAALGAAAPRGNPRAFMRMAAPAPLEEVAVTAARVTQEQLGDLKLYRVPDRTTVASRQSKQVRLLDRSAIPITAVYGADLSSDGTPGPAPASRFLRTLNSSSNHLGLPLPSGQVAVFVGRRGDALLERESGIRDLAVDEELEIDMGASADVEVTAEKESAALDSGRARPLPAVPGSAPLDLTPLDEIHRVRISNARSAKIQFELRLRLPEGARVVRADHPLAQKNGRPIFRLAIPADSTATLRYQTQRTVVRAR